MHLSGGAVSYGKRHHILLIKECSDKKEMASLAATTTTAVVGGQVLFGSVYYKARMAERVMTHGVAASEIENRDFERGRYSSVSREAILNVWRVYG